MRDPSPSETQGRNYAGGPSGGFETFRIRLRIRAMLRAWGPLRTQRILRHISDYPEAVVRASLQLMLEAGEVCRPAQEQRWRLTL